MRWIKSSFRQMRGLRGLDRAVALGFLSAGLLSSPAAEAGETQSPSRSDAPFLPPLAALLARARERAPEVQLRAASLRASRSSYASARLAPVGNPFLEITVERGGKNVTRDVALTSALWLPIELSSQSAARRNEAADFVSLHQAELEQARAIASARTLLAYGRFAVASQRWQVLSELVRDATTEAEFYAQRVAAGDATERDAALAALEVAQKEVLLGETRSDLVHISGELSELTGYPIDINAASDSALPRLDLARFSAKKVDTAPSLRVLSAEARFYASNRDRYRREGSSPLGVGVLAGRGDFGETRLGAGLSYALPVFRTNQPERARADAERVRALETLNIRREVLARRIELTENELGELARALSVLTEKALPAAKRAVAAARETQRAGKGDLLSVLVSRRDWSTLLLRRLELVERSWLLLSELVEITGELP